jgi:hypothetical protein
VEEATLVGELWIHVAGRDGEGAANAHTMGAAF